LGATREKKIYSELIVIEGVTERHEKCHHRDDVIRRKKPNSTRDESKKKKPRDESLTGALVIRAH